MNENNLNKHNKYYNGSSIYLLYINLLAPQDRYSHSKTKDFKNELLSVRRVVLEIFIFLNNVFLREIQLFLDL